MVVLLSLKIRQDSHAAVGIGHYLAASIDQSFVKNLLKDPPNRLHETKVHGLIRVVKVNPSAQSVDNVFPLLGIGHDNFFAGLIVLVYSQIKYLVSVGDVELFVNLELNWKTMTVPAKSSLALMACH